MSDPDDETTWSEVWRAFRGDVPATDLGEWTTQYDAEDACEDDETITRVECIRTTVNRSVERYSVFNRYERRCQGVKFE